MHTTKIDDIAFLHNGDFSGDVTIIGPGVLEGPPPEEITLPMITIEQLLAEKYRKLLISRLEELDLSQPGSLGKIVRVWGNAQTMLKVY